MRETKFNNLRDDDLFSCQTSFGNLMDFLKPVTTFVTTKTFNHGTMRTNIEETKNEYKLFIEVPGVNKEDIKISLDDGYLKVEYDIDEVKKENEKKIHLEERTYGKYSRDYFVGFDINKADIKASLKNGILEITLPKVEKKSDEDNFIKVS